ncbi:MAG: cytochrome b/b6 domain-containing protein [Gammaproteobacteria bacterium]|nr:cytochrome b/b6 domain-containing protein [Gammaproteobacteria bacterium]
MQNKLALIKVWDPLVRLFHWTLVLAFFIAYITEEDFLTIHSYAGYIVTVLIAFRVVWGFIGSSHARFTDFIYSLAEIRQFLKNTLQLKAKRYLGHNPAGGAMVIIMLVSLIITCVSGFVVYGIEDQAGPLAAWLSEAGRGWGKLFEELHELFANFTLLLVIIHVAGVIVESLIHKENLIKSMINGMKRTDSEK